MFGMKKRTDTRAFEKFIEVRSKIKKRWYVLKPGILPGFFISLS